MKVFGKRNEITSIQRHVYEYKNIVLTLDGINVFGRCLKFRWWVTDERYRYEKTCNYSF